MRPQVVIFLSLSLLVLLGVPGCSTTALRAKRIEANPDLYATLTEEDRALVDAGRIREGMGKEAVFLAWGSPRDVRRGSRKSVPYEIWTYAVREPLYDPYFTLGYGYGYHGFHHHGHYYHHPNFGYYRSFGSQWVYRGAVEFLNGRVGSWEWRG